MTILEISELSISIGGRTVVDAVSFTVQPGESVGIIGESGSGKSLTLMAVLGLLPEAASVSGSIRFEGTELLGGRERAWRRLRGDRLSCVFQEPQTALDPLSRIGAQLVSPVRARRSLSRAEARSLAVRLATEVGLPQPEQIVRRYPHELSGGQRQRVVIAMAMAASPALILADEPTTALDATVQAGVLDLLGRQLARTGAAMVLVTHDVGVAASRCEQLLVMRHGRVVERGVTHSVLTAPQHDYTRSLVDAAYATSWQAFPQVRELVPA